MLILPIKKKWFDMILNGDKKEEYREIKPYYTKRLYNEKFLNDQNKPTNNTNWVLFRNGYSKKSPTFLALCSLEIKQGNANWGAIQGETYYVLSIKEIKQN